MYRVYRAMNESHSGLISLCQNLLEFFMEQLKLSCNLVLISHLFVNIIKNIYIINDVAGEQKDTLCIL